MGTRRIAALVAVGGTLVAVGGTLVAVAVGGTLVAVGGTAVAVGGTLVAVGGTAVATGGTDVAVAVGVKVGVARPCAETLGATMMVNATTSNNTTISENCFFPNIIRSFSHEYGATMDLN